MHLICLFYIKIETSAHTNQIMDMHKGASRYQSTLLFLTWMSAGQIHATILESLL